MSPTTLLLSGAVGVGATVVMDVWHRLLKRLGVPAFDYCLLGRWVAHMPTRFKHSSIAAATPKPLECPIGWITHYSIGVSLAVAFVALATESWLERPTLVPALAFGVATVVMPLFILQPCLGLGAAGSRTPHPNRTRLKSLVTHSVFGLGMYASALLMGWVLGSTG